MEVGDIEGKIYGNPLEMRGRAVASAGGLLQSRDETGGFYLKELRER